MKTFTLKYLMIATMTLLGMSVALYADLKIGEVFADQELDRLIMQLTLLMAFDIIARESLRLSLLQIFHRAFNDEERFVMFSEFSAILAVIGIFISILYSLLYQYLLTSRIEFNLDLWVAAAVFELMILSAGLQLILNLKGDFFLYSLRNFLIPLAILTWLFLINSATLEIGLIFYYALYVSSAIYLIKHVLLKRPHRPLFHGLKKYFVPPLYPLVNFSALQTSRYLERLFVANVALGASYYIYFCFKIYAALVSLVGLPVQALASRQLMQNSDEPDNADHFKVSHQQLFFFVSFFWLLGFASLLVVWHTGLVTTWFPKLADSHFTDTIFYYLVAAWIGSLNLPLQAYAYKHSGHLYIARVIISLNFLYALSLLIGSTIFAGVTYTNFVGLSFLSYTTMETILTLRFLRLTKAM